MNCHRPYCFQSAEKPDEIIRADTRDTWRFFDNFVQVPEFTQSYNRYSYCLNNPLQWVDPSGELSFNDWYIDSKRNLQWFESTSEHIEINGEIYNRIGNTVLLFSHNGQKVYGDEYGGIHYLYPLGEVVIGMRSKSFSSPLRGAGFFRIGDPAEQEGNFSSNFQYVAPINPGYINGLNALAVSMGTQYYLIKFAARSHNKSILSYREFRNLSKPEKTRLYNQSIGKSGKILKGVSKWAGNGTAVISMIGESVNYYNYTTTYGFDWKVAAKFGIDMIMTGVGFLGPVGFTVSSMYFILDVSTGGFGGFGEMR